MLEVMQPTSQFATLLLYTSRIVMTLCSSVDCSPRTRGPRVGRAQSDCSSAAASMAS